MKTSPNDTVFPIDVFNRGPDGIILNVNRLGGMTKREYFAALALQGLLSNSVEEDMTAGRCVNLAVLMAEGLILELNK